MVLGMGGCVVSEDGLFIPPARMSVHELRTELTAGGVDVESVPAGAAGKKELIKLAKVWVSVRGRRAGGLHGGMA